MSIRERQIATWALFDRLNDLEALMELTAAPVNPGVFKRIVQTMDSLARLGDEVIGYQATHPDEINAILSGAGCKTDLAASFSGLQAPIAAWKARQDVRDFWTGHQATVCDYTIGSATLHNNGATITPFLSEIATPIMIPGHEVSSAILTGIAGTRA